MMKLNKYFTCKVIAICGITSAAFGSFVEHVSEYHIDTQTKEDRDDERGKNEAREGSKEHGVDHYRDSSGRDHDYLDGHEVV